MAVLFLGAFLVPYFIAIVLEGIPLFHLELATGQLLRTSSISIWSMISPYLGGIGSCLYLPWVVNVKCAQHSWKCIDMCWYQSVIWGRGVSIKHYVLLVGALSASSHMQLHCLFHHLIIQYSKADEHMHAYYLFLQIWFDDITKHLYLINNWQQMNWPRLVCLWGLVQWLHTGDNTVEVKIQ